MNRKQRRALEKKGISVKPEPTYTVKPSQMAQMLVNGPGKDPLNHEVNARLLEQDKKFCLDMDTMVLWTPFSRRGWGYKRLKEFYKDMFTEHLRMRQFYETDDTYPERHKLKEKGIDVEKWYNALFDDEGNFKPPEEVDWDAL